MPKKCKNLQRFILNVGKFALPRVSRGCSARSPDWRAGPGASPDGALKIRFPVAPCSDPANFRQLVLGCMDSYDSDQRLILQGFSRSTRFAFFSASPSAKLTDFCIFFVMIFADFRTLTYFCCIMFAERSTQNITCKV